MLVVVVAGRWTAWLDSPGALPRRAIRLIWVRFQWRGKEVRRSGHTISKATAQQFLAGLLDEHRRLDRGGCPRRTYKEALERSTYDYMPEPGTQT